MKIFNLFINKKKIDNNSIRSNFTNKELKNYDKHVDFYYTNLINSIILFTYDTSKLDLMAPILFDPLTELYEELDYAFIPILFETVFYNNLIDESFRNDLLQFKEKVDKIPNEIWDWEYIDTHDEWKKLKIE
ncbi:hypothetical protein, partial [Algoriella sp.]